MKDSWPRQGVIRVELFLKTPPADYDLQRSYHREYRLFLQIPSRESSVSMPKKSIEVFLLNIFIKKIFELILIQEISKNKINEEKTYSNKSINTSESLSNRSITNLSNNYSIQSQDELKPKKTALNLPIQSESTLNKDQSLDESSDYQLLDGQNNNLLDLHWLGKFSSETRPILEYSPEYGLLRLTPTTRQRLNIEVLYVKLGETSVLNFSLST